MSLKKVIACIERHNRFLITSHTNLEGDALGSELALYNLLKKLGKSAVILNADDFPPAYDFLPGRNNIKKLVKGLKIKFDCFVVLDCTDLKRTGGLNRINIGDRTVLNIDHHISNRYFANVNWVEQDSSCCCEMIYKLYRRLGLPLGRQAAIALYTGMLTDTGSFRYSNTTSYTHRAVSACLKYNIDAGRIYKSIYEDIPFQDMQLLARILPEMKRAKQGKVIWFQIKRNMLKGKKLFFDLSEHILSFGRAIKDVEVAVLFKENLGPRKEIRVNLRSQGRVDVNRIAAFFGGGGHRTASGVTIPGRIEEVRRKVLAKIQESLTPA